MTRQILTETELRTRHPYHELHAMIDELNLNGLSDADVWDSQLTQVCQQRAVTLPEHALETLRDTHCSPKKTKTALRLANRVALHVIMRHCAVVTAQYKQACAELRPLERKRRKTIESAAQYEAVNFEKIKHYLLMQLGQFIERNKFANCDVPVMAVVLLMTYKGLRTACERHEISELTQALLETFALPLDDALEHGLLITLSMCRDITEEQQVVLDELSLRKALSKLGL